jgi:hypothetical protein
MPKTVRDGLGSQAIPALIAGVAATHSADALSIDLQQAIAMRAGT